MLTSLPSRVSVLLLALCAATSAGAQKIDATLRLAGLPRNSHGHAPSAVAWLTPESGAAAPRRPDAHTYRLLQKDRSFTPHLLVVPVGSSVAFPNEDPFFHNVFSLFDGKRFDLGLYEAGSSKSVVFGREGVSYIFCNIHPEMSAIVVSLSTSLYAIADTRSAFRITGLAPGAYTLHLWVEGARPNILNQLTRRVTLSATTSDLGTVALPSGSFESTEHTNKFGKPYEKNAPTSY